VNINAYHQPGVEAGKKAAASVLDLQQKVVSVISSSESPLTLDTLAIKANATEQIEAVYKIVRHLAANGRAVKLEGNPAQPASLKISRL
jgi:glucose-6-phosphate isomerase